MLRSTLRSVVAVREVLLALAALLLAATAYVAFSEVETETLVLGAVHAEFEAPQCAPVAPIAPESALDAVPSLYPFGFDARP